MGPSCVTCVNRSHHHETKVICTLEHCSKPAPHLFAVAENSLSFFAPPGRGEDTADQSLRRRLSNKEFGTSRRACPHPGPSCGSPFLGSGPRPSDAAIWASTQAASRAESYCGRATRTAMKGNSSARCFTASTATPGSSRHPNTTPRDEP